MRNRDQTGETLFVDKKKVLIVAVVVAAGVAKGPFLYRKVTEWYSKKTGALIDSGPKVGFGEYLLPPLKFDVLPGDCEPFFSAILKIDLSSYRKPGFSVSHASLPMLSQGCVIPDEPYFSAVNRYTRECLGEQTESKETIAIQT